MGGHVDNCERCQAFCSGRYCSRACCLKDVGDARARKYPPLVLTPRQEAIVLGTVLGDSTIQQSSPRHNAYLSFSHSAKQSAYAAWKVSQLGSVFRDDYPRPHTAYAAGKGYACVHAASRRNAYFNALRSLFYPEGKKTVSSRVLQMLSEHQEKDLALAVWYMDDGCLTGRGKHASLVLGGMEQRTYTLVQDWFRSLGYQTNLRMRSLRASTNTRPNAVDLWFDRASSALFFSRIQSHVPASMEYKLGPS